jgi:hypothetical protein
VDPKVVDWWVPIAIVSSLLGSVALIPWWFGVGTSAPATTMAVNAVLLLWDLAILVGLLVPELREQATSAL